MRVKYKDIEALSVVTSTGEARVIHLTSIELHKDGENILRRDNGSPFFEGSVHHYDAAAVVALNALSEAHREEWERHLREVDRIRAEVQSWIKKLKIVTRNDFKNLDHKN